MSNAFSRQLRWWRAAPSQKGTAIARSTLKLTAGGTSWHFTAWSWCAHIWPRACGILTRSNHLVAIDIFTQCSGINRTENVVLGQELNFYNLQSQSFYTLGCIWHFRTTTIRMCTVTLFNVYVRGDIKKILSAPPETSWSNASVLNLMKFWHKLIQEH